MATWGFTGTRTTALCACMLAFLLVGVPSFLTNTDFEIAGEVEAQGVDVDRIFIIAVDELTADTLNPNTQTMVSEGMLVNPTYSTLLQLDVDQNLIGDLALDWDMTPDGLTWHFKLVDDAYWIDPRDPDDLSYGVTADDVIFTFQNLMETNESRMHFYFPWGVIDEMWKVGDYDLWIRLDHPFAPIWDSWTGAPILPKYYWEGADFIDFDNDPVIGSGPFYLSGLSDTSGELMRNDHWYQTENRGWQIHFDKVILKEVTSDDTKLIQLNAGEVDCVMRIPPEKYLNVLPGYLNTVGFSQDAGFVYEFNLNQMTDELRAELGGNFNGGDNSQILLDPTVKRAIAMSVNKTVFVDEILIGLGTVANTIVPRACPWFYEIPEDKLVPVDRVAARKLLNDAGWKYDLSGELDPAATPLCKLDPVTQNAVDALEFIFYTLDTSPEWEKAANKLAAWLAEIGVKTTIQLKTVSQMNSIWYTADYDIWLWDWDIPPLQEGSGILELLTTMSIGSSSDIYWSNATYDALYNLSLITMDPVERREIYNVMQQMIYDNMGCQLVAYANNNYGVSTVTWDPESLGDWNTTYMLLPDTTQQWYGMQAYPKENHAPYFTSLGPSDAIYEAQVDVSKSFLATAADDDTTTPLVFRWFWGDGTKTDWSTSGAWSDTITHTYTEDGIYTVYVAVREDGPSMNPVHGTEDYDDNFTTVGHFQLTVRDLSNRVPTGLDFSWTPSDPDSGVVVQFTGTATDPDGDPLYYAWEFGDGSTLSGQVVEHQFVEEDYYTVTMYVDDKHIGADPRPVERSKTIYIARNNAPFVNVQSFANIPVGQSNVYTVTATDDEDDLRLTWNWGDGSVTVTTGTTASHTYSYKGTYTLTVFADDLTGLDGHNVSDSGLIYVYNPMQNEPPEISLFELSEVGPYYTGQVLTFDSVASDGDGDPLKFTVEFGDGTFAVESFPATTENAPVEMSADKAYSTAGSYTVYLHVSDGDANTTCPEPIELTIVANYAPLLEELPDVYASKGVATTFTADATDYDGDPLKYTWIWGDGSETVTTVGSAVHTYSVADDYIYRVWVADGKGHNVTDGATAFVNTIPVVSNLPSISVREGIARTYTATASDADGDTLTYTWDFGDGTGLFVGNGISHTYASEGLYTYTVWVDDGFPLATHNVSKSGTVTVLPPGDNVPPEILTPLEDRTETIGETVIFSVEANDPDGDSMVYTWDFGDDVWAVGPVVSHVYSSIDVFTYTVYVDDCTGTEGHNVTDCATMTIVADEPPVADAGPDDSVDEDEPYTFDGSGSSDDLGVIVDYAWTIVELEIEMDGVSPTYTFEAPGTYHVQLVVEDSIGQLSDPDEMVLTVNDITPPTAVADALETTVNMDSTVYFDGSASFDNVPDNIVSYVWTLIYNGTLRTLTGATPDFHFWTPDVYTVELEVEDAAGNTGSDSVLITVIDDVAPVADAGDDDTIDAGTEHTFDGSGSYDNVEDNIVSYSWTFEDDGPQLLEGVAPTYLFENVGVFTVTLTVEDAAGNTGTDEVVITVNAGEDTTAPVADAGVDQSVAVGATVTFDGSDSTDDSGAIDNYTWTFEYDGATRTLYDVDPTWKFDIAGEYTVTLNVTDAAGNYDTDTMVVTVEAANVPPVANAGPDATITVGETHDFSGAGSSDSDGSIVNYTWTFTYDGQARTLYGVGPSWTFDIAGEYTVTLTVRDDDGATATDTVKVTVEEEEEEDEEPGFPLALVAGGIIALIAILLAALLLMKRRKSAGSPPDSGEAGEGPSS